MAGRLALGIVTILLVGFVCVAHGDTDPPATLSEEDVVRLFVHGVPADELIRKIETSPGDYDLSDEMIEELSRIESEADTLEKRAKQLLFGIEEELGISAIFWYKIIDDVGEIADYAERVGNRLRLLTAN